MVLAIIMCSDLFWIWKSSSTGKSHKCYSLAFTQLRQSASVPSECELSHLLKLHSFIGQSICDCAPKRMSSLNKTVPSSSLCFDKDFMGQVMSEVHLSVCKADASA